MPWDVEAKLRSFVAFSIAKLDSAEAELTDEDEDDNFAELVVFTEGLSRNLRNVGASGSPQLKAALIQAMQGVWDLRSDKPGPNLKAGGVPGLRKALEELLSSGPLGENAEAALPAPQCPAQTFTPNLNSMSLQEAVSYMWDILDKPNRVEYGDEGFTLDLQNKGKFGRDSCHNPLFSSVNEEHPFWSSTVTRTFVALLDNYEREVGKQERITAEEKQEMADFIDALAETKVIQFVFHYLQVHGKDKRCAQLKSVTDFCNLIYDLWLAPYRRVSKDDSSGFEHVFVGEERNGKITGLHNWVQYYLEEKKGNIDYLGWVGKQDSDYDDDVNIVTVKFAFQDDDPQVEVKPMSTILCGSTVEFEVGLLTLIFLAGNQEGETPLKLGTEKVKVTCYPQRQRYCGPKVATAFLEIA